MESKNALLFVSRCNRFHTLEKELNDRGIETFVLLREECNSLEKIRAAAENIGAPDYLFFSSLQDKELEGKNFTEISTEEYELWRYYSFIQFFEINHTFVKKMRENGGGVFIGMGSVSSVIPSKNQSLNGASGASLVMGIQCLAEESCEDGIYANMLCIGAVEDNEDFYTMTKDDEMLLHVPDRKPLDPDEVCKKIADIALLSDRSCTGNIINIDAGFADAYMRDW